MLFPEATTTNGKAIISFKTGAFSPGLPVQPMVIKYPHKYVNPCWCDQGGPLIILFQLMTQFVNFMEVLVSFSLSKLVEFPLCKSATLAFGMEGALHMLEHILQVPRIL